MWNSLHYRNWPLRIKFAALLILVSLVPSALTAYISLNAMRQGRIQDTERMLIARAEQLSHELDSIHSGYLRSLQRVSYQPAVSGFCTALTDSQRPAVDRIEGIFSTFPKSDPKIRGLALVGADGVVQISTDGQLVGQDMSQRATVSAAMRGSTLISDIYISTNQGGTRPTVAYLVPVQQEGKVRCVLAMWVDADAVWSVLRTAYEKAGPSSFAVLYDGHGIRIGHSFRQELVFRPGGPLPPDVKEEFVKSSRFGPETAKYLEDVRLFPEQFNFARSANEPPKVFRGFASANGTWNYGVGSRLSNVRWTVFYMMPEASLNSQIAAATHKYLLLFALIALYAVGIGIAFAATIVRPIMALRSATRAVATGKAHSRVVIPGRDEFGHLAENFNDMAEEIQTQAENLHAFNEELVVYSNELESTNKDLEAFAYSVSHDLRSPLNVVNGFSNLLAKQISKTDNEKAAHYINRICASTKHMDELIEGLLELSKLGRQLLNKKSVALAELMQDSIEQLRNEQVLSNHDIKIPESLPHVFGDKVLLRQVLVNLLSNAAKFSAKVTHPVITIDVESKEGEIVISVSDNGPGFEPALAHQLFQPFKRLHSTEEFSGIGLGLSIVQRIVLRHGGRVWAEAVLGQGATFSFSLPATERE